MLRPTDCIAKDFNSAWYKKWAKIVGFPVAKHPKFWEIAAIAEVLESRGYLKPGKKGLGMGVGTEQLASVFAAKGVTVLATDQDPNQEKADKWDNGQLAGNLDNLFYEHIVDEKTFRKNVRYEHHDMTAYLPKYKNKFDFVWHNCVIGHLGSLEASVKQLKDSANYLKEDGTLVFTTELNLASLEETFEDNSDTVIWRLKDLEKLFLEMAELGMVAERFELRLGSDKYDTRVNYNHFNGLSISPTERLNDPTASEIKIPFAKYVLTQIILVFKKTDHKPRGLAMKYHRDTQRNIRNLLKHVRKNPDLNNYWAPIDPIEYLDAIIMPERKEIDITIEAGSVSRLDMHFLNRSEYRMYDATLNLPYSRPPLTLATFDPVNRDSILATPNWSSPNRPGIAFRTLMQSDRPEWNPHQVDPGAWFSYGFDIQAPKKAGAYQEKLVLVFEGIGAVLSSIVTINITVTPKNKATKKELGPREFLKLTKFKATNPKTKQVLEEFLAWTELLAKDTYYTRRYVSPYELLDFLEVFFEQHGIKNGTDAAFLAQVQKHKNMYIQINPPSLVQGVRAEIIAVAATPRVGGTVISTALGKLLNVPRIADNNFDMIDINTLSSQTVVHTHLTQRQFKQLGLAVPSRAITVARNPVDTLISAFTFSQRSRTCVYWQHGKVFQKPLQFAGKDIKSKAFLDWATGPKATALLSVSPSWWNEAAVSVKYEDFINKPTSFLKTILQSLNPQAQPDEQNIEKVASELDRNFLKETKNQHRWNGGVNYGEALLSTESVNAIKEAHSDIFSTLSY